MNINQKIIIYLLGKFSSLVKKLSEDELKDLIEGNITIELVIKDERGKKKPNLTKKNILEDDEVASLISQLRTYDERAKGLMLLEEKSSNKSSLKKLAKYIDTPINQKDSIKTLKDKIIEATIGYRLRSKAIQGNFETDFLSKKDLAKEKM